MHESEKEAREEAARLCRKEGTDFYIFECTAMCSLGDLPLMWTEAE
jgi:hypothetical protein